MRKINEIIIHHSGTKPHFDSKVDFASIKKYHLSLGYKDIAYHYIIGVDGTIMSGRPVDKIGAHCKGYNKHSIGICLVGDLTDIKPSPYQIKSLNFLLKYLFKSFGAVPVYPHNYFSNTICPGKFLTNYFNPNVQV